MAGHLPIWFLHFLYPAKEPNFVRDRPLQVLALGLGRTGTESLALALEELGYGDVYHGWKTAEYPGCFVQWTRFGIAKFSDHEKDPSIFTALEFDKAIGHCGAITDLPAIAFGPELLRAYPNAKVVLNRRADLDAWYESQKTTVDTLHRDWLTVLRSLFDNDLFWVWQGIRWGPRKLARGNFEQYGRAMYHDHYAQLEAECRKQGREYLDWTVQDGWYVDGELSLLLDASADSLSTGNHYAGSWASLYRIMPFRTRTQLEGSL